MYVVPCRHPQLHALDLMLSRSYLFTIILHYKYLDVNWHYGKSIYGKNTYYSFGTLHSRQFLAFSKQQMVRAWWSEISALPLIQRSPHSSLLVRVQKVASLKKKNGVAPFFLTPVQIPYAADTVRKDFWAVTQFEIPASLKCLRVVDMYTSRDKPDMLRDPWLARPLGVHNSSFIAKGTNYLAHRCLWLGPRPLS